LLDIDKGHAGICNIAEPSGYLNVDEARRELGWDPGFRGWRDRLRLTFIAIWL